MPDTPNTPAAPPATALQPAVAPSKKSLPPMAEKLLTTFDDLLGLHSNVEEILEKVTGDKSSQMTKEERDIIKRYEEGLQRMLDVIAPAGLKFDRSMITLNDQQVARSFYAYNWPSQIYPNWLAPLINFDAQMDISLFIYPASNKVIMKMLRKKVTEMRSSIRMLQQRGIVRDPALEAALQDAEELRDLLARGSEKLFQLGFYFTIYSENEQKLKKTQTDIEAILGGKLVLTKPAVFQMEHAWNSCLPYCLDELDFNRNMNTSALATSFPFSSSDLTDDHGILYGINRHNDSLIIFDRFDLPNANANVFATSGAGKSYVVKLEILRSLIQGVQAYVIDPENEYVDLCRTVGGAMVPISLQSSYRINPFDLPKAVRGEDAEVGEVLRSAVINLHGLFKLMLGNITPAEEGVLDKAILNTYALKGITVKTEDPCAMEPPVLGNLIEVLMTTDGGETMAQTLMKYTEGSFSGLFDRPTNVELDKQMVVFQIRDLEDVLRPIAIYVVLNFLWNRIRAELKKRFLVIDEAWNLMQYEDSAQFLYGLIKRARKYYLGVTTITQDIDDFINSPYGKPIVSNTSLQLLLKQSAASVDNLAKLFYLTEGEKYLLLSSGVGQGVLFAGNTHVAIQIVSSPGEHTIITTKPEEVLKRREQQKAEGKKADPASFIVLPPQEEVKAEEAKPEVPEETPVETKSEEPPVAGTNTPA